MTRDTLAFLASSGQQGTAPRIARDCFARWGLVIVLVVAVLGYTGTVQSATQQEELLYRADQAYQNQAYHNVLDLLAPLLQPDASPGHAAVFLLAGHSQMALARYDEAVRLLQRGCERFPEHVQLRSSLGQAALQAGDNAKALTALTRASTLNPDAQRVPRLLYQAAVAAWRLERPARCSELLQGALKRQPGPAPAHWLELLVHANLETGNRAKAREGSDALLERAPDKARYWRLAAHVAWAGDNRLRAAVCLETAARLSPPTPDQRRSLAGLYASLDAPLRAAALLQDIPTPSRTTADTLRLSRLYERALRQEKAIATLDQAPATPQTRLRRGEILYRGGRFAQAQTTLASICDSRHSRACLLAGYAAWHRTQWDQARGFLSRIGPNATCADQAASALAVLDSLEETYPPEQPGRATD